MSNSKFEVRARAIEGIPFEVENSERFVCMIALQLRTIELIKRDWRVRASSWRAVRPSASSSSSSRAEPLGVPLLRLLQLSSASSAAGKHPPAVVAARTMAVDWPQPPCALSGTRLPFVVAVCRVLLSLHCPARSFLLLLLLLLSAHAASAPAATPHTADPCR